MVHHVILLSLVGLLVGDARHAPLPVHFADADNVVVTNTGKQAYAAHCASCHGRSLQGQPLWRMADDNRSRRAPALDGTGPGWRHSDEDLFVAVRDGHFPAVAANPGSRMPAFRTVMKDDEIVATLAFIKDRWPTGQRILQSAMNGGLGLPSKAGDDWRFPADCKRYP